MWNRRTVSIVLPAYNEEQYIRAAVEDFFAAGVVDEVIVVDNNSRDATAEEAAATRARVVQRDGAGIRARAAARACAKPRATSSSWPSRTARSSAATS